MTTEDLGSTKTPGHADSGSEEAPRPPRTDNVTVLSYGDKELHIIATAHVSRHSVEEVQEVIGTLRPDSVCVELDETRHRMLVDDSAWEKLDIFQILRERRALFSLATLSLTAYQRRLGKKVGVRPGAELLAAVRKAEEVGARVVLADRDIQATLRRSFANLSVVNKAKMLALIVAILFAWLNHELTEEQVEALKDRDTIGEATKAFAAEMPEIQIPLIDERDRYLMASAREAPGRLIVAVVGAGHVEGMKRYLNEPVDRAALSVIPPRSILSRLLPWILAGLVVGAACWGYRQHGVAGLSDVALAWVLPHAALSLLLCVLVRASLPAALAAAVSAPITALVPHLSAASAVGAVEAKIRRPTRADCARIPEDLVAPKGMRQNPFTRVLLVAVAAAAGSALGTAASLVWLLLQL